jgi:sugar fermentation stimulation protein A
VRFERPLIEGTFLRRDGRFVADILLTNGEEISAHCANPGSLRGCAEPGSKVLVSLQDNPRLKFKHQLEIIYAGRTPVAVHAGRPVAVVAEAIAAGKIPELAGYAELRRDTRKSRVCRIDLVVRGNGLRPCYMRVENVTHAEDGTALHPDHNIEGAAAMMQELTNLVREGNRVMVMFVAQRADVERFRLADDIDTEFTQVFRDAIARGVETSCYRSKVTRKGIELDKPLELLLGEG